MFEFIQVFFYFVYIVQYLVVFVFYGFFVVQYFCLEYVIVEWMEFIYIFGRYWFVNIEYLFGNVICYVIKIVVIWLVRFNRSGDICFVVQVFGNFYVVIMIMNEVGLDCFLEFFFVFMYKVFVLWILMLVGNYFCFWCQVFDQFGCSEFLFCFGWEVVMWKKDFVFYVNDVFVEFFFVYVGRVQVGQFVFVYIFCLVVELIYQVYVCIKCFVVCSINVLVENIFVDEDVFVYLVSFLFIVVVCLQLVYINYWVIVVGWVMEVIIYIFFIECQWVFLYKCIGKGIVVNVWICFVSVV